MRKYVSTFLTLLISSFFTLSLWAQEEKKVDVDISLNKGDNSYWYQQPWVWVVGGAVFILLLVVLARGNNRQKA